MTKRPYTPSASDATVGLAEAAALLGVERDVLIEALVDHGLSATAAAEARLLTSELEAFRTKVRADDQRLQAQLAALRLEFEDE